MPHFGAPALLLLQLLAALPATAAEADATPLRFSVMESWSMPLVRLQRGQPIDGIVYDITRSLARQVGRKALYHPYPRGRIEQAMNAGEIDVRCYISPAWLSHDFPGYRWSVALLVQRDILVAREGFAPIPEALPASVSVPSSATAIRACSAVRHRPTAPRRCAHPGPGAGKAARRPLPLRGQPSTVAALEQPPGAGAAAATPGSRAARRDGGELPGAGLRGGSGGSDTEDVREK